MILLIYKQLVDESIFCYIWINSAVARTVRHNSFDEYSVLADVSMLSPCVRTPYLHAVAEKNE